MEVENVPLFGTRSPRRPNRAYVPAMGILRLSHVDITVPDLDLAAAYYTGVIGMDMTDQVDDRLFFKCWDEEDHHSLAVRFDPRVGIDRFAFKVEREDDLDDLERKVESYGFAVSRVSRGEEVGQGESIRFATPSGHEMELVYEVDRLGSKVGKLNPEYRIDNPGIAPPRMDHMLINAEEVGEATKFFMDVLGFRLTEQLIDAEGHQIGTWLERSHRPHDIAIVSGPNGPSTTSPTGSTIGTTSARRPTYSPTTPSPSTSGPPVTASPGATRSTSSIRWAPVTRCSPADTGPIPTSRPSPGPKTTSARRSSTTKARSTTVS
jgi:catechol 2,3-dioxygenase-like lactoylglutathione lyase family enzyme